MFKSLKNSKIITVLMMAAMLISLLTILPVSRVHAQETQNKVIYDFKYREKEPLSLKKDGNKPDENNVFWINLYNPIPEDQQDKYTYTITGPSEEETLFDGKATYYSRTNKGVTLVSKKRITTSGEYTVTIKKDELEIESAKVTVLEVTFKAGDGTFEQNDNTTYIGYGTYDDYLTGFNVPTPKPNREGVSFIGWQTDLNKTVDKTPTELIENNQFTVTAVYGERKFRELKYTVTPEAEVKGREINLTTTYSNTTPIEITVENIGNLDYGTTYVADSTNNFKLQTDQTMSSGKSLSKNGGGSDSFKIQILPKEGKYWNVGTYSDYIWIYTASGHENFKLNLKVEPEPITLSYNNPDKNNNLEKFYGEVVSITDDKVKVNNKDNFDISQLNLSFTSSGFAANADVNGGEPYNVEVTSKNSNYKVTLDNTLNKITVKKATPNVEANPETTLKEGQPLGEIKLTKTAINPFNSSMTVKGNIEWDDDSKGISSSEEDSTVTGNWTFIPTGGDENNYTEVKGQLDVKVSPLTPTTIYHTSSPQAVTYDGEEHPLHYEASREGKITVKYKKVSPVTKEDIKDEDFKETPPKDAGTYIVVASIDKTNVYAAQTHQDDLVINPLPLTYNIQVPETHVYDGTTNVNVTVTPDNVIKPDDVNLIFSANLSSKDVGDREVLIKITALEGNNKDNYKVSDTSEIAEFQKSIKITPKTIETLSLKQTIEKVYGQEFPLSFNDEDFNESSELVGGDEIGDLQLLYSSKGAVYTAPVKNGNSDTYEIKAKITGGNYQLSKDEIIIGKLKINKATPEFKSVIAGKGYEGGLLSQVSITGSYVNPNHEDLDVTGTFTWDEDKETTVTKNQRYKWKFELSDSDNYNDPETPVDKAIAIEILERKPITFKNIEHQTCEYNGNEQPFPLINEDIILADTGKEDNNPVDPKNIIVTIFYKLETTPSDSQNQYASWNNTPPTDAGIYEVRLVANAGEYSNTRSDNELVTKYTIQQKDPDFSDIGIANGASFAQGTSLSEITNQLLKPKGLKGSSISGDYSLLTESSTTLEEDGTYTWNFTPSGNDAVNYKSGSVERNLILKQDERKINADVFNTPSSAGNDYAIIDVSSQNLKPGETVSLYSDSDTKDLVGSATVDDLQSPLKIELNQDTLKPEGGSLFVKISSLKRPTVNEVTYNPELGYTISSENASISEDGLSIVIEKGKTATLKVNKTDDSYSIQSINFSTENKNVVNLDGTSSDNDPTVKITGGESGATTIYCKVVFNNPDQNNPITTIEIDKEISVLCREITVNNPTIDNQAKVELNTHTDVIKDNIVLTQEDIDAIQEGSKIEVDLTVTSKSSAGADESLIKNEASGFNIGSYFDIKIEKTIIRDGTEKTTPVTELNKEIKFTVNVPTGKQDYRVIRVHNSHADTIMPNTEDNNISTNGSLTFSTDKFSTYAIAFKEKTVSCTISSEVKPANAGTVKGIGIFTSGKRITLKAIPNDGYRFKNWTLNGKEKGTSTSLTITVTKDETYTANFEEVKSDKPSNPGTTPSTPSNPGSSTNTPKEVTGVKISGDRSLSLNAGQSKKLTVTLEPSGAQGTVKWSSSDTSVVKVDQSGNLTAVGAGRAMVSVECNGHKDVVTVTVKSSTSPSNPQPSPNPSPQPQPQPNPQPSPQPQPSPAQTIEVYRLYLPSNNEHLYTTDKYEAQVLKSSGWTDEGVGWISPTSGDAVYRLYSPVTNEHHYTSDVNEVNTLKNNGAWTVDNGGKPLFYSGGSQPIYRLYHEGVRRHHLTKDQNEFNVLRNSGWNDEGIALHSIS